jgi:hypothetical protein
VPITTHSGGDILQGHFHPTRRARLIELGEDALFRRSGRGGAGLDEGLDERRKLLALFRKISWAAVQKGLQNYTRNERDIVG